MQSLDIFHPFTLRALLRGIENDQQHLQASKLKGFATTIPNLHVSHSLSICMDTAVAMASEMAPH